MQATKDENGRIVIGEKPLVAIGTPQPKRDWRELLKEFVQGDRKPLYEFDYSTPADREKFVIIPDFHAMDLESVKNVQLAMKELYTIYDIKRKGNKRYRTKNKAIRLMRKYIVQITDGEGKRK